MFIFINICCIGQVGHFICMSNKHIIFKSIQPPIINLFLYEEQLENINVNYFIDKIKNNIDKDLSHKTNVKGKMTGWYCFRNDPNMKNLLGTANSLVSILKLPPIRLDECWGTWSSTSVETLEHKHTPADVSAILYLTEGGPGTFFPQFNINIEEKIGKIVFFHADTLHSVRKCKLKKDRFLISFNFNKLKFWENNNG